MTKRIVPFLITSFWWTLLSLLVVSAVVISLARELAPNAYKYRAEFDSYLSRVTGLEVNSDAISAGWHGLAPEVEVQGVRVVDRNGDIIATLERVFLQIDLLSSLWNGALTTRSGEIVGLNFSLRQRENGLWFSSGSAGATEGTDVKQFLDSLFRTNSLILRNSTVKLITRNDVELPLVIAEANIQSRRSAHSIEAQLLVGRLARQVQFLAEFEGLPWSTKFDGEAYLDIRNQVIDDDVKALALESRLFSGELNLSKDLAIGGQLWATWDSIDQVQAQGEISLSYVPLPSTWEQFKLHSVRTGLAIQWDGQRVSRLLLENAEFQLNDTAYTLPTILIEGELTGPQAFLQFDIPYLDLAGTSDAIAKLPDSGLTEVFATLSPVGTLRDLSVKVPFSSPNDTAISAQLDGVNLEAWGGAPAVTNLSGELVAGALNGYIDIQATDLTMAFPTIYHGGFETDQTSGRVYWQVDPSSDRVQVGANNLQMLGPMGVMSGAFYLDGLTKPVEDVKSKLTLQIGLDHSQVVWHETLVPFIVSPGLRDWLDSALVAGDIAEADFVMLTEIDGACSTCTALQLKVDAQNTTLNYLDDWPAIEALNGRVIVNNDQVTAEIEPLSYLGGTVVVEKLFLAPNNQGVMELEVDAITTGESGDIIQSFQQTPVWSNIESTLGSWGFAGEVDAEIKLSSELSPGVIPQILINAELNGVDMIMDDVGLSIASLTGHVESDLYRLESTNLEGVFYSDPLSINLSGNLDDLSLGFNTKASMTEIADWIGQPLDLIGVGTTDFTGSFSLRKDAPPRVIFQSNLAGVAIDLPDRWSKTASEETPLRVTIPFYQNGFTVEIDYRDDFHGKLEVVGGALTKSSISLGKLDSEFHEPRTDIWLSAELDYLDPNRFLDWFSRKQTTFGSDSDVVSGLTFGAAVRTNQLRLSDDILLTAVEGVATRQTNAWKFDASANEFSGGVRIADGDEPWELNLDYLNLPGVNAGSTSDQEQGSKPISAMELRRLPELNVRVDGLSVGGNDLGRWQFRTRNIDDGFRLENIIGQYGSLSVEPAAEESLWVEWRERENSTSTALNLRMVTNSFEQLRTEMDWKIPIKAEQAELALRASWHGNPLEFDLLAAAADVDFNLKRGRLETSSASTDAMRLFNLFNFNTWARRLQLDFSDLEKGGISFDELSGRFILDSGHLSVVTPVELDSPSSRFVMTGTADLNRNTVDSRLNITLPVGNNVAWITAIAVSLPAAAGVFLASQLFEGQVDQLSTLSYKVDGSIDDPNVTFERFFGKNEEK
ncbi:AsmA-like C-terminal region-containing protein [uncultured Umboniibacter sp.]|uniref:YhdP family phospholipid transporter n=1 Tax=uncultured Umboniibacter sp. TaxID=1798917 RepID=UPI00262532AF|nr:AsmA-like C-terminal region-containing protein [uncultured Umboniibacter sp.]